MRVLPRKRRGTHSDSETTFLGESRATFSAETVPAHEAERWTGPSREIPQRLKSDNRTRNEARMSHSRGYKDCLRNREMTDDVVAFVPAARQRRTSARTVRGAEALAFGRTCKPVTRITRRISQAQSVARGCDGDDRVDLLGSLPSPAEATARERSEVLRTDDYRGPLSPKPGDISGGRRRRLRRSPPPQPRPRRPLKVAGGL